MNIEETQGCIGINNKRRKDPEILFKAKGREIFNFLACESNKIAAYFNVDEEDLTFSQILDYYDSHKEITYALREW